MVGDEQRSSWMDGKGFGGKHLFKRSLVLLADSGRELAVAQARQAADEPALDVDLTAALGGARLSNALYVGRVDLKQLARQHTCSNGARVGATALARAHDLARPTVLA